MKMDFNNNKKNKKAGKVIGYLVMYFVFTTVFYFILKLLNRIPESWKYYHVMPITLALVLLGTLIKMLFK